MYDYTLTKEEQKKFIKNYEIKDGSIIITFGDNQEHTLPYSEKTIENINKLMEEQVKSTKKSSLVIRTLGNVSLLAGSIALTTFTIPILQTNEPMTAIMPITGGILSIYSCIRTAKSCIRVKDFEKNKTILQIQNHFNQVANTDPNTFTDVIYKTVKEDGKYQLDLKVADEYSCKDVQQIKENLERIAYVDSTIKKSETKEFVKK